MDDASDRNSRYEASVESDPSVRSRRRTDFAVLAAASAAGFLILAVIGEASLWAAVLGLGVVGAFFVAYFLGTTDLTSEALRLAQAAAEDEERRTRTDSERRFRLAMIDAFPEPVLYVDGMGKIETANAGARRLLRLVGVEPLLSVTVRRAEFVEAVSEARKSGVAQIFEYVERGDTDRYFSCVAAPLVTSVSAGVLVTMHDLTDIKRAELARVDFLANASHELRTPLTSLSGFIETLRGPARDDPEAWDRFLEIMQGQADRMRRLISDLLSLSRIELNEHRPPDTLTDLTAVVREVVDALQPVAKARNVRLEVRASDADVIVAGIRDELSQVAQNLIDNAIKYSDADGVVEIEVLGDFPYDEAIHRAGRRWDGVGRMSIATFSGRRTDNDIRFAVLRVCDAGPGIDRQYLPRLAERFYRVDPGRGLRRGTGLGLAIVKHVIARHRGDFVVESEVGRGSAFGIVLPSGRNHPSWQGRPQSGEETFRPIDPLVPKTGPGQ